MGENSKIEWTDHTFNPWIDCRKVSDGCKFCYAERDFTRKPRWANTWGPPATSERIRTSEADWRKPLAWDRQAKAAGIRQKVFCASLADIFEDNPQVEDWRYDLYGMIEATTNLDWLLLTKRPENIIRMTRRWLHYDATWPGNVWLGASAENQKAAGERIPLLLQIPAAVRFVSCEPLLGPVDLTRLDVGRLPGCYGYTANALDGGAGPLGKPFEHLDWVIVGGESGPNARPMHPDWARAIRDQCVASGVPFFFKQWGEWLPDDHDPDSLVYGVRPDYYTDPDAGYSWRKVGKKAAGRLLDGREWNEVPQAGGAWMHLEGNGV